MSTDLKQIMDTLTDEQKELAKQCKTPEDFMKLAQISKIKLSDEQLDLVAAGSGWWNEIWYGCECDSVYVPKGGNCTKIFR